MQVDPATSAQLETLVRLLSLVALSEDAACKWLRVYWAAEADSRRCFITLEELQERYFAFNFLNMLWLPPLYHCFDLRSFRPDGVAHLELTDRQLPYLWLGHAVQIAEYPAMLVSRDSDWRWWLKNQLVCLRSTDVPSCRALSRAETEAEVCRAFRLIDADHLAGLERNLSAEEWGVVMVVDGPGELAFPERDLIAAFLGVLGVQQ